MENKKQTNGQLMKKIKNAVVFVPKDKEHKWVFFDDKMLRIETTQDYAVISTGFHRHVFAAFNPNQGGYSRPYLYTKKMVEIAFSNDCKTDDNKHTFEKLLDVLKQKEDKSEYNIATYYGWWLLNIFQPLYQIGENEIETFVTYEDYIHNIARSSVILSEKDADMTNIEFVEKILENEKSYIQGLNETVLFHKMTDKEMMENEIKAVQEIDNERIVKEQITKEEQNVSED